MLLRLAEDDGPQLHSRLRKGVIGKQSLIREEVEGDLVVQIPHEVLIGLLLSEQVIKFGLPVLAPGNFRPLFLDPSIQRPDGAPECIPLIPAFLKTVQNPPVKTPFGVIATRHEPPKMVEGIPRQLLLEQS